MSEVGRYGGYLPSNERLAAFCRQPDFLNVRLTPVMFLMLSSIFHSNASACVELRESCEVLMSHPRFNPLARASNNWTLYDLLCMVQVHTHHITDQHHLETKNFDYWMNKLIVFHKEQLHASLQEEDRRLRLITQNIIGKSGGIIFPENVCRKITQLAHPKAVTEKVQLNVRCSDPIPGRERFGQVREALQDQRDYPVE